MGRKDRKRELLESNRKRSHRPKPPKFPRGEITHTVRTDGTRGIVLETLPEKSGVWYLRTPGGRQIGYLHGSESSYFGLLREPPGALRINSDKRFKGETLEEILQKMNDHHWSRE